MIDVPLVERVLLVRRDRLSAMHLSPARETWHDAQSYRTILRQIDRQKRARTDQAHMAAQYIEELRQFIEPARAQETAQGAGALLIGQKPSR